MIAAKSFCTPSIIADTEPDNVTLAPMRIGSLLEFSLQGNTWNLSNEVFLCSKLNYFLNNALSDMYQEYCVLLHLAKVYDFTIC